MKNFFSKHIVPICAVIVIGGATFTGGFFMGVHSQPEIEKVTTLDNKEVGKNEKVDFSAFWKTWNVLNEKFVSSASTTLDQDKVWGAIEGLTASLKDPYTVFFSPENSKEFASEISGNFEGVGMEVGIRDGILAVITPLKGSPAEKAGMLPGDKIIKIDSTSTEGLKVEEAVRLIHGKKDTQVVLTVIRDEKKGPIEIKITRGVIAIPTIDTEVRTSTSSKSGTTTASKPTSLQENGVFVIRLYSFSQTAPDLFRNALREFVQSGSDKLILDLRGNPGGYLSAAVDMASWFLPAGKIIVTEDFGKNQVPNVYRSRADSSGIFSDKLKFAVLVNGGSASASEILAGALQEYGVAKLVGSTTYGKGSVQELVDITPDTSLKVTVARWLTPKGKSISLKGITPDVKVDITEGDVQKGRDPQMEAAYKLLTK
ncbi:MAG: S41 family peptidase [Patescibacteria group bacterium]